MKILKLLIVSNDAVNSRAIKDAVDQSRFAVTTVSSDETAVEGLCQQTFDIIVTGKEITNQMVRKLNAVVNKITRQTALIQQKEESYETLTIEINKAYIAKQREALRHITVNDTTDVRNVEGHIRLVNSE